MLPFSRCIMVCRFEVEPSLSGSCTSARSDLLLFWWLYGGCAKPFRPFFGLGLPRCSMDMLLMLLFFILPGW